MKLTADDVRHVAKLAALEISEQQIPALQEDLSAILDYVNRLSSLATPGVIPTSHVHGVVNAFRDDLVKESLPLEDVLQNAPEYAGSFFKVPKII